MTDEEEAKKEAELITTETPQLEEPAKTKTQQFIERLNEYSDLKTAKEHIQVIAEELGCKAALGYKALRKSRFMLEQAKIPRPEVPAFKIEEGEALPPSMLEEPTPTETPPIQATPQTFAEAPISPAVTEPTPTPMVEKLTPIFERSIQRLINNGLEAFTGAKDMLDTQEAKDTATLIPILLYRFTKISLNEDQFIDVTLGVHFGSIVVKIVNKRLQARKVAKKEEPVIKSPEKTERPIQKPPTEQELKEMKEKQNPPFLAALS